MARTLTQLRQHAAELLGLGYVSGTADSGGSTTILKDSSLGVYPDDALIGRHVLLTSGSPSLTELVITDSDQSDTTATFIPTLGAAPDTLTYEILPFSGTEMLRAFQHAILDAYDTGLLVRPHLMRLVAGSPLYNADWSYWTSAAVADGWARNGTGTIARERASANVHMGETSLRLSTAADYVALTGNWLRWLEAFKGQTVRFSCPVKTSTASIARLNLNTGSNNFSPTHGGGGNWEVLSVEVAVSETASTVEPRLYNDGTANVYFGIPQITNAEAPPLEYPFPLATLPSGPDEVLLSDPNLRLDAVASGRGLSRLRTAGRHLALSQYSVTIHRDEATTTEYGLLDLRSARNIPADGNILTLRGSGPLNIPTASADNLEVSQWEGSLLAHMAAVRLLERGVELLPAGQRDIYREKMAYLQARLNLLKGGATSSRQSASLPMRW